MLIAAAVPEISTHSARALLSQSSNAILAYSEWTLTEAPSGLAIKHRTGQLAEGERRRAFAAIKALVEASYSRSIGTISGSHALYRP